MDIIIQGAAWLENSSWASGIQQSLWLYPALEIAHILGIVLLVGAAFLFDLRLLGFGRSLPIRALSLHLLPWSRRGLWLIIPSGLLLFISNASSLSADPTFWLKIILLIVAAINVLIFHRFIFRSVPEGALKAPAPARISAAVSIVVWIAIIACGRLLAY